jgi:hypothetical protein
MTDEAHPHYSQLHEGHDDISPYDCSKAMLLVKRLRFLPLKSYEIQQSECTPLHVSLRITMP